jgi:prevent-host-death family protein
MDTNAISVSELRRTLGAVLDDLGEDGHAVYVTRYGQPVAVLVDYEHYEQLLAELDALTQRLDRVNATAEPTTDYTAHLAGLHHEIWDGIDTEAYLQRERDAWED